jgi:Domain of unknown function (DUF222)
MAQVPHPGSQGDGADHGASRGDGPDDRGAEGTGAARSRDADRTDSGASLPQDGAGIGEQFAAGAPLDEAAPGPELAAALAGARAALAGLSDDALAGFLTGCQKVTSWVTGLLMEGIAEFADRRPDDRTPGRAVSYAKASVIAHAALAAGEPADPPPWDEFAPDELTPVLRVSKGGATRQIELAQTLRYRLHATRVALLAGRIDGIRARIIAEGTDELSPAHAAQVEALVLPRAGRQTYVALGIAVGKAVLRADPAGAIRRRKRAEKRARVERWREYDGTGALAGRNLPPGDTLAADQALTDLALELREAGLDGSLDYLRATALIDRITGRDSRVPPGDQGARNTGAGTAAGDPDADDEDWEDRYDWPSMDAYLLAERDALARDGAGSGDGRSGHGGNGGQDDADGGACAPPAPDGPGVPGVSGRAAGTSRRGQRDTRIGARINLTIPLATLLGLGDGPGEAGPFGPLDAAAARDLARMAAAHRATRWCITVTDGQGRAVAHGCAHGPQPWAGQTPRDGPGARDEPGAGLDPGLLDPDLQMARFLAGLGVTLDPIAVGSCDHHGAEARYRPSRKLRHKIHIRTPTCAYWGCRRPAERCDDDHTLAWEHGGLSCECNLAPLCRRHHRMKQREGWVLTQPEPGLLTWQAPSGRRYVTLPACYSV